MTEITVEDVDQKLYLLEHIVFHEYLQFEKQTFHVRRGAGIGLAIAAAASSVICLVACEQQTVLCRQFRTSYKSWFFVGRRTTF